MELPASLAHLERSLALMSNDDVLAVAHKLYGEMKLTEDPKIQSGLHSSIVVLLLEVIDRQQKENNRLRQRLVEAAKPAPAQPAGGVMRRSPEFQTPPNPSLTHNPFAEAFRSKQNGK